MKKLFGLFLLALAFLAPSAANAASRFWVGGTGTWDASDTTHWSATQGGAGGQSVPGTSDDVTFDGSSGGGTVTVNATITVISLTMSAFTGTLDFATNNNNITLSGNSPFTNTGSGTRTLNMGNGTWTLSGATASFSQSGATNLTFNANSSIISYTGTGAKRFITGNSRTYSAVTVVGATSGSLTIQGGTSVTIGTLTISAPNRIISSSGVTTIITTLTNISASVSTPVLFTSDSAVNGVSTISSANNFTCDYCGVTGMTFSGGGTFAATNSYSFGQNSGITITAPTVGTGGGRIIGG